MGFPANLGGKKRLYNYSRAAERTSRFGEESIVRFLLTRLLACVLVVAGLMSGPSMAQETFVIVPDHPQGVPISGCYRANQLL